MSNGVHTDLVLPIKNKYQDWSKQVPFTHTLSQDSVVNFMAFGWGDKGFYLDTPTWADLKMSTALNAMFSLGSSAMHVTPYQTMNENESCKKVTISAAAYQKLVQYIQASFWSAQDGQFQNITGHHYHHYDSFYHARGSYSLFKTCNTWANQGLKHCGVKTSVWTPFDKGIFYHL